MTRTPFILSRYKRRLPACAALVAGALVVSISAHAAAARPVGPTHSKKLTVVTVAGFPSAGQVQFAIGSAEGIFARHGLKVEYTANNNLGVLPAAAAANQYDFVMTVAPIFISAVAAHLPVVATLGGALESTEPLALVVPNNSGISTAASLEGKSIATGAVQGNFSYCLRYWMYAHGAHNTAVNLQLVPITNMPAELNAGLVNGALINAPFSKAVLATGQYVSLGDPCTTIGSTRAAPQLLAFDISNATWARSNGPTIKAMRAAIVDVNKWIQGHKTKALAMVASFSDVPLSVIQGQPLPAFVATETPADVYRWETAMEAIGVLPGRVDLSAAIAK